MLKNMSIAMRLASGFGAVLFFLLMVAGVGYWGTQSVSNETASMLNGPAKMVVNADDVRDHVIGLRRFEKDYFLNIGNKEKEQSYHAKWNAQRERLMARMADIDKYASNDDDKKQVAIMREEFAKYEIAFSQVRGQIDAGDIKNPAAGNAAMEPVKDSIHAMEKAADDMGNKQEEVMAKQGELMFNFAKRTVDIMLTMVGIAVLVALGVALVITRGVVRPVNAMDAYLRELSSGDGDLTKRMEFTSKDEIGKMADSLNSFCQKLEKIIIEVKGGVGSIASASQQVASSSSSLSQGTSEQAASVEETTSSLEEMSASITQNSENSRQMELVASKGS